MRRRLVSTSVVLAAAGVIALPGAASATTTGALDSTPGETVITGHPNAPVVTTKAIDTKAEKTLKVEYQAQETGYWCGPAATRIALSARKAPPSQGDLASQLGTTENGTDDIDQVTGVLNQHLGDHYQTKRMPDDPPSQEQKDQLWNDIVRDIDGNYPVVTNIVAPPGNQPPGYPPDQTIYHYFTVVGYNDADKTVQIADPANFGGNSVYWLSFDQLASLIPPKGYAG
jgi:hypothetical protein